jgi:PAS domain S-box-containing protein
MSRRDHDPSAGVFEVIDAGLIVLGSDRKIAIWNDWMAAASGITAQQAIGAAIDDIFPQVSSTRLRAAVTEALEYGVSSIVSSSLHPALFPLKTRTGRKLIHNVTVRPLPGEPPRCLIQITDVSAATERERVLRERQNARYDAVVDSAPDAIVTIDANGIIQLANPAAANELGFSPQELLGQPITMVFQDQGGWASAWTRLLAGNPLNPPVELKARRKNGSISFVEVSASRWQSESRLFVTAILRDVNQRRTAEIALRELNQTLEQRVAERTADRDRMWRLSSDVMLVVRRDGTIVSTNPAWQTLLGWDEASLIGAPFRTFVVPEDARHLDSLFNEISQSRARQLFELGMRTRDGETKQIAWNAVPVDDLLQAVGRDMTVERDAQAALLKAEEALRQSHKMEALGQLTGGIAHDFNNMLSGIIGAMELLKLRVADGRYSELDRFITTATSSAERAAALTHRLLAFARRQPLDPRPVDVNQLILDMEDLLRRSLGEQMTLRVNLSEETWGALVDANQLENALLNLAINSRDAMPRGGILTIATATAKVEHADSHDAAAIKPGEYTVVSVRDTGQGMSEEVLARVFDPFFTTKPIGQGTGLGLSMIYGFITQSRGHVRIDSELGKGTTVELYLPRHYGDVPLQSSPNALTTPQGAGETVLLVEDDSAIRLLVSEVLQELGYTPLEAGDGPSALALLGSDVQLHLMITDVGLPGINGRQLAEIARQHRPDLKVLFLTGYAEHATARNEFLGPGMDMMTKPFALGELARKIQGMIEMGAT